MKRQYKLAWTKENLETMELKAMELAEQGFKNIHVWRNTMTMTLDLEWEN
jgi:hypothetical protein